MHVVIHDTNRCSDATVEIKTNLHNRQIFLLIFCLRIFFAQKGPLWLCGDFPHTQKLPTQLIGSLWGVKIFFQKRNFFWRKSRICHLVLTSTIRRCMRVCVYVQMIVCKCVCVCVRVRVCLTVWECECVWRRECSVQRWEIKPMTWERKWKASWRILFKLNGVREHLYEERNLTHLCCSA